MNFEDESRFGVRLPIRTPPSSLALTRISNDNFVTRLQMLRRTKSVRQVCPFSAALFQPTQYSDPDFAVIAKQSPHIVTDRLELADRKGLQLFVERCGQRPSPVDISWCIAMGSRRVVDDELNDSYQLARLVGKALHDVFHQHSHHLLSLNMSGLNETLFDGPPRCTEPVA